MKFYKDLNGQIILIQEAVDHKKELDTNNIENYLKLCKSKFSNIERFINVMKQYRLSYPDIVEPILANIHELLYGIELKISILRKLFVQYRNFNGHISVHKDLVNFLKFPILDAQQTTYIGLITLYNSDKWKQLIKTVISNDTDFARESHRLAY